MEPTKKVSDSKKDKVENKIEKKVETKVGKKKTRMTSNGSMKC